MGLPMSLCAIVVQTPTYCSETCPSLCLRAKDHLRTPKWRPSRGTAPHKKTSPAAQRTGRHRRVATRERASGTPTEERASDCVTGAVRGYVRPRPRKRHGAQALCNFTFTQPVTGGSCRERHASRPALSGYGSPVRLRPSFSSSGWVCGHQNFGSIVVLVVSGPHQGSSLLLDLSIAVASVSQFQKSSK